MATRLGLYGGPRSALAAGAAIASVELSGTAVAGLTEAEIVAGGKTFVWTLTNDTFVAAGTGPVGSIADSQALIDGIEGSSTWNTARSGIDVTDLVRDSDTQVTLTLPALTYDITADDTLTSTVPADVLTGGSPLVAPETVTITADVEDQEQPTGGYGAYNAFTSYQQRKRWREKKRRKILEELREIEDVLDREIAEIIHEEDEESDKQQDVAELREIVTEHLDEAQEYAERVTKAFIRAATQQNFAALMAFEREMDRMIEEEEFMLMAVLVE